VKPDLAFRSTCPRSNVAVHTPAAIPTARTALSHSVLRPISLFLPSAGATTNGTPQGSDVSRPRRLQLDGDAVVDLAEDERAERGRDDRGGDEVDDVARRRKLAGVQGRAQGLDRRRDRVAPVEELLEGVVLVEPAGELVDRVQDRGQEEPGQKERGD